VLLLACLRRRACARSAIASASVQKAAHGPSLPLTSEVGEEMGVSAAHGKVVLVDGWDHGLESEADTVVAVLHTNAHFSDIKVLSSQIFFKFCSNICFVKKFKFIICLVYLNNILNKTNDQT
jgi:hypothetical protein